MNSTINALKTVDRVAGGNPNALNQANLWQALKNKFTGNLDYQRNLALQQNAQAFNAEEAQKQRDYEERLSNTVYQRQVADLGKAGYNPAMALGAGGAYTPSGAFASSPQAHYSDNTRGFEFLANALITGLGLGIKASMNASQIALNEVKGATLGAGSASQIALNTMRGAEFMARAGMHYSRKDYYDVITGDRKYGNFKAENLHTDLMARDIYDYMHNKR